MCLFLIISERSSWFKCLVNQALDCGLAPCAVAEWIIINSPSQ